MNGFSSFSLVHDRKMNRGPDDEGSKGRKNLLGVKALRVTRIRLCHCLWLDTGRMLTFLKFFFSSAYFAKDTDEIGSFYENYCLP